MNTLEIVSGSEFGTKSGDCKILAKSLGDNHWSLYIFHKVVNGNIYVEEKEVSCNSIYSPCYKNIIKGTKDELNLIYTQKISDGYNSLGWFEQDIFGVYRRISIQ